MPDARDPVGDGPAFARADEHDLQRRELALEVEHLEDVAARARHGPADTAAPAAPAPAPPRRSGSAARPRCAGRPVRRAAIRWGCGRPGARARRAAAACRLRSAAHSGAAPPLRAARCGTGRGPTRASRRPCPRPSRQARRTGTCARAVIGSMSAPVSITAPCPAKMLLPASGATSARVTPSARLTAIVRVERIDRRDDVDRGAERRRSSALVSSRRRSAPTGRLRRGRGARSRRRCPGVTHLPVASITCVPAGSFMRTSPAATIRPSRTTTVPFGIGSEPSPSATVPPVMAKVCAAAGAAAASEQRSDERGGSLHVSFARLAELEVADRPLLRIVRVVHHRAVDPHPLGPRVVAERIAVPQHDVGHLARRQRAGLVEDAERLGRIAAEPFPGDLVAEC